MSDKIIKLVERFQCPGCVCGCGIDCGKYKYDYRELRCVAHVLGTYMNGALIALGMPKGFNRAGWDASGKQRNKIDIRLFLEDQRPEWDNLNVPVWAIEQDGFLFVRTFAPRVNITWVDIIEKGKLSICPNAINVSNFIEDIDTNKKY